MPSVKTRLHYSLLLLPVAALAEPTPAPAAGSLNEAVSLGKPTLASRARYEQVDQDGLRQARALTLGANLGFLTAPWRGFQGFIEGEATIPIVDDYYDGTDVNTSGRATIADPELYELNQAWLSFSHSKTKVTLGRQKLALDNARFIGDVGWRQNQQTFDAVVLQEKSLPDTTLTYAYLDRVNRVFDDRSPNANWDSNSHVVHAAWTGLPDITLTGYGLLLDLASDGTSANARAARLASTQTYGASLVATQKFDGGVKLSGRLEAARQSDYASSPLSGYTADYYLIELGASLPTVGLSIGYEVLGSDHGRAGSGFRTPLATLHAHNGWADKFLGTPDAGLNDAYARLTATPCKPVALTAVAHWFGTEEAAADIGRELDLQATWTFDTHWSTTAKAALYDARETAPIPGSTAAHQSTNKFWLQVDYTL